MTIDWKKVAPKRADWERLSAEFKAAGLPHTHWLNGVPQWEKKVDEQLIQSIVNGEHKKKKR